MTTSPFAQIKQVIDGGSAVFGGQTISGGNTVQLSGVSNVGWVNQLWEIYEYPNGFALPAGWTNSGGIYQSNAVTPPVINIPAALANWGKYFWRLTVNDGLLNGIYMGPLSTQPLVDEASAVKVLSPFAGLTDIGFRETNQFDAIRQWIGEWKATLRAIETASSGAGGGSYIKTLGTAYTNATNVLSDTLFTFPLAANELWYVNVDMLLSCSGVGGVKFAANVPAGCVIEGSVFGNSTGFTAVSGARMNVVNTATANAICSNIGSVPGRIWLRVKNSTTPGTFVIRAQSTTNGQTSTINVGSTMTAQRAIEV